MTREPLYPFQYEAIWFLLQTGNHPRPAADIGACAFRHRYTAQKTASILGPLVRRGWVERVGTMPTTYRVTERAIQAVTW